MADSPFSVYRLLRQHILAAAKPAYLVTSKTFELISVNGELEFYELSSLKIGESCESQLDFLIAYDTETPLELRFYQINAQVIAHVVLLPHEEQLIVLFMDASEAYHQEIAIQQKTNDLLILSERQDALVKKLVKVRDALASKHKALRDADESKTKFIASMSNEIKLPLTSILGHTALLQEELKDNPAALKKLEAVERGGRHLLALTEKLLDQMDMELSDVKLKTGPTDINGLLQDLDALFAPVAKRKDLKFITNIKSLPPGRIRIDEARLRQVLVNLLDNAFKYTELGTVELRVEWDDNDLLLEVYDTGKGIPESLQKEMFTAFKQGDAKQTSGIGPGIGLGLSIVKHLIDLMDGEIICKSIPGTETRFKLLIPSAVIATYQHSKTITDELVEYSENTRVLLIESNADLCQLYGFALSKAGFTILQCQTAADGLKLTEQQKPGLILVSLADQEESLDTVRQIRSLPYTAPILVQLNSESGTTSHAAFEAGTNGYITRPITIFDFVETIKAYLAPDEIQGSDAGLRDYLRERFNEYLERKVKSLFAIITQLSGNVIDAEQCQSLEKGAGQILHGAELYDYTAIANVARLIGRVLKNRDEFTEADLSAKLLEIAKVLDAEVLAVLNK